jgi:Protein of unknown function (DUF732)
MNGEKEIHGDMSPGRRVKISARLTGVSLNRLRQAKVQPMKRAGVVTMVAFAIAIAMAATAHADPDVDFGNELHTYGIYGPTDYNAWIGKIVCERLHNGVDQDAYKSAQFVSINLQRGNTTGQSWQFLGAALHTYCPDQLPVLERAAAH